MVQLVSVAVPELYTPPPCVAEFPLTVQLVSVAVPELVTPPPSKCAEFPLMVQLVSVAVPSVVHPAAVVCGVSADGAVGERRRATVVVHRRRR